MTTIVFCLPDPQVRADIHAQLAASTHFAGATILSYAHLGELWDQMEALEAESIILCETEAGWDTVLPTLCARRPDLFVLPITTRNTTQDKIRAFQSGAIGYQVRPVPRDFANVLWLQIKLARERRMDAENEETTA